MDRSGLGLRRLTGLLLILNLGVMLGGLGLSFWPAQPVTSLEFNGDKVRFLSAPEPIGKPAPEILGTEPAAREKDETAESSRKTAAAQGACLSWPGLDAEAVAMVEARLRQAGFAQGGYELSVDKRLGWWVFQPPFKDADAVRAAMDEARAKGVVDMAPVRGGKMANALSLGAFPNLDSARAHASALIGKGMRDVKFGPRPETGEVRLRFTGQEPDKKRLDDLRKDWPSGLQPRPCATDAG